MTKFLLITMLSFSCLFVCVSVPAKEQTEATAAIASSDQAELPPTAREGKLFWKNGDSLDGSIVSAGPKQIVWKSPFFVEPLQLSLDALSTIRFETKQPTGEDRQTFRIVMKNGDILFGHLKAINAQTMIIDSKRHGTVELIQDKVRTLRRVNNSMSTYLGPHGLEGWTNPEAAKPTYRRPQGINFLGIRVPVPQKKAAAVPITSWQALSDGRISTSKNEGLYREFNFPDRCEIECVIEATSLPAFSLMLGKNKNDCLRIESWEETLVALSGYDFVELDLMKKDQRKVHLHIYLDKKKKLLAIYSHSGKKLGEVDGSKSTSKIAGFYLQNEGDELTLNYLRIDPWNGDFPQPLRSGDSRIQLTDGVIKYGKLIGVDQQTKSILFGEADTQTSIPIEKISSISLEDGRDKEDIGENLQITWLDGGLLSGKLVNVKNSNIEVLTDYSKQPILSSLSQVHKIHLPQTKSETPESETPDKVFFNGGTLRGHLIIENQSTAPIKWKPIGGLNTSELNSEGKAKFLRGNKHPDLMFDVKAFPDVLFLKNNDVLPCQLINLTQDAIEVKFPMSKANLVAHDQVKAIEFASSKRASKKDFTDKKWTTTGSAKLSADNVLFPSGNCTLANPDILTGDDVQFQLDWAANQYAKITIFLNSDNVLNSNQYNSKTVTAIEINSTGENLWVSKGTPQQQGRRLGFGGMQQGQQRIIPCPDSQAKIQLLTRDGAIHVSINGEKVFSTPLNRNGAQEKGIFLSTSFIGVRSTGGVKSNNANKIVRGFRISKFEVNSTSGSAVKQYIQEEARLRTLTIPRFRRDDPPTHVIVAPNGDLLRGRLLSIDEKQISFESKLEVFRFQRERIASIIWLPKPVPIQEDQPEQNLEQPQKPVEELKTDPSEIQLRLAHGYSLSMKPQLAEFDKLKGHSSILGECSIPSASIKELILGNMQTDSYDVFAQWITKSAPEPEWDLPDSDSSGHQLVGTEAKNFELPMLDGSTFKLSDHADKVVVLDFWASWCGPCVLALPGYIETTSQFDSSKVIFVAVNLREAAQPVRTFLARENLSPAVALDSTGEIGSQFGVSGIPHTVIISPKGVIEYVKTGYSPTAANAMKETIEKILDGTWERKDPPAKQTPPAEPAI